MRDDVIRQVYLQRVFSFERVRHFKAFDELTDARAASSQQHP